MIHDASGKVQPSTTLVQCVNCGQDVDPEALATHYQSCEQVPDQTKELIQKLVSTIHGLSVAAVERESEEGEASLAAKTRRLQFATDGALATVENLSAGHKELKENCESRIRVLELAFREAVENKLKEQAEANQSARRRQEQVNTDLEKKIQQLEKELRESTKATLFNYVLENVSQHMASPENFKVYTFSVKTSAQGYKISFHIGVQGQGRDRSLLFDI